MGDKSLIEKYCADKNIRVIASIPYDSELGLAISNGFVASEKDTKYMELFKMILETVEKEVQNETTCDIKR
jgi:MinD superfamily P-loop ATPase